MPAFFLYFFFKNDQLSFRKTFFIQFWRGMAFALLIFFQPLLPEFSGSATDLNGKTVLK